MSIFLILDVEYREDTNGREYVETEFYPDSTPGYFETLEEARAWVMECQREGRAKYLAAVEAHAPKMEEYRREKAKRDSFFANVQREAKAAGLPAPVQGYFPEPSAPREESYCMRYEIHEVPRGVSGVVTQTVEHPLKEG